MELREHIIAMRSCTVDECENIIDEMVSRINLGESADEVLIDEGFESDYEFDLLNETC